MSPFGPSISRISEGFPQAAGRAGAAVEAGIRLPASRLHACLDTVELCIRTFPGFSDYASDSAFSAATQRPPTRAIDRAGGKRQLRQRAAERNRLQSNPSTYLIYLAKPKGNFSSTRKICSHEQSSSALPEKANGSRPNTRYGACTADAYNRPERSPSIPKINCRTEICSYLTAR